MIKRRPARALARDTPLPLTSSSDCWSDVRYWRKRRDTAIPTAARP